MKKVLALSLSLVVVTLFACTDQGPVDLAQDQLAPTSELAKKHKASPNALFHLDFSDPADVADNTATSPGWVTDRYSPETFQAMSFDGDDRLEINIDEAGPTSGFYGYQGKKYQDAGGTYWFTDKASRRLSYQFYIDPAWEEDGVPQQTGMWLVLGDPDDFINAYPILEYQDSDANVDGEAGFRAYVYLTDENGEYAGAEWLYIGLPRKIQVDPEEGGWVTVEAQLHKTSAGNAVKWRVNNRLILDERNYNYSFVNVFYPSTQLLEIILNSANFGVDQDYYYDDISLVEPGHAGK